MGSMKWMLGAALAAGAIGFSAAPAEAAQFGVYVGVREAVPPCPGPGYVWIAGYWADGYWVPGYWNYVGVGPRVIVRGDFGWDRGPAFYHRDFDRRDYDRRDYDRHDFDRRDFDRHDRDNRGFDRNDRFRR